MRFPGFVGPSYESRSVIADAQRCVNLYPEIIESGSGKSAHALYRCPGLSLITTLDTVPVRCFIDDGTLLFAIAGDKFYSITSAGTATERGTVSATEPCSMACNGPEVAIASGGALHIYNIASTVLTDIAAPPAGSVTYADGYFIVHEPDTQVIWISGLIDGLTWNALDFASAEAKPDDLVAVVADHRELWLFGMNSIQPFYNSGNADFPFEPIGGTILETGAIPGSIAKLDNTLFWIGKDERGHGVVWRADGFKPVRISTHAIEHKIQGYSDLDDVVSWVYQQNGHTFYLLYIPSAETTWCYDASTNLWHERAYWDSVNAAFEPHRARCHAYVWNKHIVGDRENGKVYQMSFDYLNDGGDAMKWMRRCPHMADEGKRIFYHSLELDMQTGGVATGDIMLRWSNDGGRNWVAGSFVSSSGAIGDTLKRVRWEQLGCGRDRVFEVSGTDEVEISLINAYLAVTGGYA